MRDIVDSGDPTPARTFEPGDLVGELFADRYRVVRLVSSGANTAIFDASDEQSGRAVTLKLVRPKLAASPTFRNTFDETMRAVASLSHPNIAAVYDWGVARVGDTSTAYVVNEYLSGGSLRDLFDRGRQLTPSQALAIGLDVCRALDHAHRRRFAHTEINPSKIVFGDDRRLRVIDFGLARLLAAESWERPDAVPTHVAWYAAPEQGLGEPVDGRADVYALCLSLHEAVTGTVPFKSDSTVATLSARVGRLMPVSADLGPLASVLEHAGRPDPAERSTAAELGRELLQAASKMPRPEPLPLLSSSLFETSNEQLRNPDDPTGGLIRPDAPAPLIVVPLDEPDTDTVDITDGGDPAGQDDVDPVPHVPPAVAAVASETTGLVIAPLDTDRTGVPGALAGAHDDGFGFHTLHATTPLPVVAQPEQMPRRRRGVPWKIVLGLLVVGSLVALGVLATQLFQRPSYPVPELVGVPEAEARNLIAPNDWVVSVQRERSDDTPVIGQVVRTAPGVGVELAEGEPFLIVVSDGPLLRELPESNGVLVSEAATTLVSRQLVVDTIEQYDEVVSAGTVLSWSVPGDATLAAGALVEPGTVVQLVASLGPAPRIVPNLIGRAIAEARADVELGLQLVLTETEQVFSDDIALGSIVTQSVAEGTEVARGSEIVVAVSRGPDLVPYPDISTAPNYETAAQILLQAGFTPSLTLGDTLGAIQSVTINGEVPAVGNVYRRGALVEIVAL